MTKTLRELHEEATPPSWTAHDEQHPDPKELLAELRPAIEAEAAAGLLALKSAVEAELALVTSSESSAQQFELGAAAAYNFVLSVLADTAPAAAEIEARLVARFAERLLAAADEVQGDHHFRCATHEAKPCNCWHRRDVAVVRGTLDYLRTEEKP